jgi:hypothetical protein
MQRGRRAEFTLPTYRLLNVLRVSDVGDVFHSPGWDRRFVLVVRLSESDRLGEKKEKECLEERQTDIVTYDNAFSLHLPR